MNSRQKWALILGFLGLTLIAATFLLRSASKPELVARVISRSGDSFIYYQDWQRKESTQNRTELSQTDSLETQDGAEVVLLFKNQNRVRIHSNSLITVEESVAFDTPRILLTIHKGEVTVEKSAPTDNLTISKNGQQTQAAEYNQSTLRQIEVEKPLPVSSLNEGAPAPEIIEGRLQSYRDQLQRCFTALLQRRPNSKGQATLGFTIQTTGKVSQVEVTSATLGDPEFKICLKETLEKISFPQFQGSPISTAFPMIFE